MAVQTRAMKQKEKDCIELTQPSEEDCGENAIKIYEGISDRKRFKLKYCTNEMRIIKNKKLLSSRRLATFKGEIKLDLFFQELGSELIKLKIDELEINKNDELFSLIKVEDFKTAGNKYLNTNVKIVITEPQILINNENEKTSLIKKFHDHPAFGGHTGPKRTYAKLRTRYYWKRMQKDVANYIKRCEQCQKNKVTTHCKEPLQITSTPEKPFDRVVIDTVGQLPLTEEGNQYIITMICDLTKFVIAVAVPNKEARTIAKAIVNNCILIFGLMNTILTDKGTEYRNSIIKEICDILNIEHNFSTSYHHETVGSVERNHRVLNEYFRSYVNNAKSNWDELLPFFTYCYNITPASVFEEKFSPFQLVFGVVPKFPDCISNTNIDPIYNFDNYAKELKFNLQSMHKQAKFLLEKSKQANKVYFDKNANIVNFQIGDQVLLKNEEKNKLDNEYVGPFVVIEIDKVNLKIKNMNTNAIQLVHKNRVKKFNSK